MDGQWPQENSDVHIDHDLAIGGPGEYNLMLQDLGDDLDGLLGLRQNRNTGNSTGDACATAAEQDNIGNQRKAEWRGKRHKTERSHQLEAAFREMQHPDENQRRDIGRRIGMTEQQVRFWFQNRRSALKTQLERQELKQLQEVNEALEAELRALRSAAEHDYGCLTCVVAENTRLKEELQRADALLKTFSGGRAPEVMPSGSNGHATDGNGHADTVHADKGKALATDHEHPPPSHHAVLDRMMPSNEGFVRSQRDTDTLLIDMAGRALREFCMVVSVDTPMWLPAPEGEVLNLQQYTETMFASIFGPYRVGYVVDGTRKTGDVLCSADDLVAILMDAARWSEMFPGIVASAIVSRIITPSASEHGMIQLMDAELRVLSPGVPVRKIKFLRQCQVVQPGKWAVVDVSIDGILGLDGDGAPPTCRLLPSGCLIEVQNSSYCKVTWIVNMEHEETTVSPLYHPLILSGQALGASRWLASLQRQCEYLCIMHSHTVPTHDTGDISSNGKKNIFELSQRMTRRFYEAMCGLRGQQWRSLDRWRGGCGSGFERFEVVAQFVTFSINRGAPGSVVLRATGTVWLPGIPAQKVFDYLRDGNRRSEWDSFAKGSPTIEEGYFATGQLPGNAISILRTVESDRTNGDRILQEARTDTSCMVLAYATLDDQSMQLAMNNAGLATLSLLPSGLVILPDGHNKPLAPPTSVAGSSSTVVSHRSNTGSFVSVMYQRLFSGQPPVKPSLEAIDNAGNLLCRVIRKIKDAVQASNIVNA